VQPGALARLGVRWLAAPPGGSEEEPDPGLPFGIAVVDDMSEGQVG